LKVDLFTFGEALSVFISSDTDSVLTAKKYERVTAGAEVNVAVALARLGLKSQFFSRFGKDELGDVMIADIAAEGVEVSTVKRVPFFTAAMVRNPGKDAPVGISYLRAGSAASTIEPSDITDQMITSARWVHTTGITCAISKKGAAAVAHTLSRAKDLGVKSSFDLNLRRKLWSDEDAAKTLNPLASNVEFLIGGESEYEVVFGSKDAKAVLKDANDRGCVIAVMTNGDQPLRYSINGQYGEIIPPKVIAVDPVGSGDAFTGGTIAGLLSGMDPVDALRQGTRSGASVASMFGDWTGLPTGSGGVINENN
jgi:2-dehydro-3-deoxygluconokinase